MLDTNKENRNFGCNCNNMMNNNSNMMVENTDYPNTNSISASFGTDTESCNCCCEKGMTPRIPMYSYEFTNIKPDETCSKKEETR